ncbi:TPM domain-containing protein [Phenylobacterium sp.]|uniref:TPM domain-containing protein n=1 Tax=Phenylobacterium sp. TaxID=1871053 RepID=UPI00286A46E7|nr:TPM domain-containing protein [Phenylobacterium sp.]
MKTLSPADLAAIEAAVREAETRTTGEIYCVVAEASSTYGETPLAWAAGIALLAPALLLLGGVQVTISDIFSSWSAAQVGAAVEGSVRRALVGTIVLQGVLFAAAALVVAIPAVRRALTPRGLKRDRVRRRAAEQFLGKNLHLTRERTGVLLFVSLGERMAELIADEGIAARVDAHVWDRAMGALTDGLKRGDPGVGFADAVRLCAEVLARDFPPRPGDNPNELPDAVVLLPRP